MAHSKTCLFRTCGNATCSFLENHSHKFTLDYALPWVLSDTPASHGKKTHPSQINGYKCVVLCECFFIISIPLNMNVVETPVQERTVYVHL